MNRGRVCRMLLVATCTALSTAVAHPIHTTLTVVSAQRGAITLSVRAFADDFSASVAVQAGKRPPENWAVDDVDVARYLSTHLRIFDARGAVLSLQSCGIRRERDLYWLCVRVDGTTDVRGLRAENTILTERHADQVNVVQVDSRRARKTLLFTKRTSALPLSD